MLFKRAIRILSLQSLLLEYRLECQGEMTVRFNVRPEKTSGSRRSKALAAGHAFVVEGREGDVKADVAAGVV